MLKAIEIDGEKEFIDCLLHALVPDKTQSAGLDSDERVAIGLEVPLIIEVSKILSQLPK